MQFIDLTSDIFKLLFASHNLIQLRLICRDIKEKIENFPELTLHLSPIGTLNASSTFFASFKGKISVGSRHGWDHQKGWFSSLIDAIKRGLQVDTILPLTVNRMNLSQFYSMLNDVCISKIQMISLTFSGTLRCLSTSIASLSGLCTISEKIELNLELQYRRPREMLFDVVEQIKGIGNVIFLKSLVTRSDSLL
jgi:hypothetical protein